jgi:hypothetical protein
MSKPHSPYLTVLENPKFKTPKPKLTETISTKNLLKKEASINSTESFDLKPQGDPWTPGFLRRLPYRGVLALLAVLLCAGADAFILYKSDGKPVDSWMVSPSVLLAILSSIANACLGFARSQGVVISWGRKARRGGTLYDLSRYWESGDSILSAATPGRGFNFVALATILATAIALDGPLLQRASNIVSVPDIRTINVTALIAEELPYGYTGFGNILTDDQLVMNQTFVQVFNSYLTRAPITTDFSGCVGTCTGEIKAAGLKFDCLDESSYQDFNSSSIVNASTALFSSDFKWIPSTDMEGLAIGYNGSLPFPAFPFIDWSLQYATGRTAVSNPSTAVHPDQSLTPVDGALTCNGTLITKRCSIRSATIVYPVTMINSTVSLAGDSSKFIVDHVQAVGNPDPGYFDEIDPGPMSFITLGGLAVAAQNMFSSQVIEGFDQFLFSGSLASQYIDYGNTSTNYFQNQDPCAMNWRDPTSDIINALNEIMFRTALTAARVSKYSIQNISDFGGFTDYYEAIPVNITEEDSGLPVVQIIEMQQTSTTAVFKSNYSNLAAALSVMVLGFLVVIPTFHGFWEMGREASLNPLEIAKAFNAEMLYEQSSNAPIRRLAKSIKNRKVKYGEVVDVNFDALGLVVKGGRQGRRLELADPSRIREPVVRELYR